MHCWYRKLFKSNWSVSTPLSWRKNKERFYARISPLVYRLCSHKWVYKRLWRPGKLVGEGGWEVKQKWSNQLISDRMMKKNRRSKISWDSLRTAVISDGNPVRGIMRKNLRVIVPIIFIWRICQAVLGKWACAD
jgi:hypothetical protein